ncbi:MAG: sugar phosphate isomerase/epimerase [Cytophagaceae bacterium]|nr:sugar phosphate isomerase/epimerase [Cytophagaceae bacterium]
MNYASSRRDFLRQSGLAALALTTAPKLFAATRKGQFEHVSVQLYSVREDMKNDAMGTLKQVAAAGYKEVEPASYVNGKVYGMSPMDFRKACNDLGMNITSSHVTFQKQDWDADKKQVSDRWKKVMADSAAMGQKYLISAGFAADKKDFDAIKRWLDAFNVAGEAAKSAGLKFGFHNHTDEFTSMHGGKSIFQHMVETLDPKLCTIQFDTCNAKLANADAAYWISKYPKNFELLHVKDKAKGKDESTTLGDGEIDFGPVFAAAKKAGIKYYVIEQESYEGTTPLACIKENLARLKKNFGA